MMDKKEILKKVGGILAELNDQYEYLSENTENLSELELELFSANANFLSDHLSILIKLNKSVSGKLPDLSIEAGADNAAERRVETTSADEVTISTTAESLQMPVADVDSETEEADEQRSEWKFEVEKEPALAFELEETHVEEQLDHPLTDGEVQVIDESVSLKAPAGEERDLPTEEAAEAGLVEEEIIPEASNGETVHVKEVVISERTIAVPVQAGPETSESPALTVNDLLSKNFSQQQTLASQFNSGQNRDLKSMISLNDKLLFVRDLFNGYSLAYSEAIELVNRFDSFESADNFLKQNYSIKNRWSEKQDVADKFYQVLNRRFS